DRDRVARLALVPGQVLGLDPLERVQQRTHATPVLGSLVVRQRFPRARIVVGVEAPIVRGPHRVQFVACPVASHHSSTSSSPSSSGVKYGAIHRSSHAWNATSSSALLSSFFARS